MILSTRWPFLAVFFLIIFCESALAQPLFIPGYIIKNEGDTTIGFINYQNWQKNPEIIEFKEAPEANIQTYLPGEIAEVGLKEYRYRSAIVEMETSPHVVGELKWDPKLNFKKDTVFVRVVFSGDIGLFYLNDQTGKEHFYIQRGNEYLLLIYKRYMKEQNKTVYAATNTTYKNQLSAYLAACEGIQRKITNTEYTIRDLKKLFQHYFKCTLSNLEFKERRDYDRFKFGLVAGAVFSTVDFSSSFGGRLSKVDFSYSKDFTGGIFMQVLLPKSDNRWAVNNELLYSSYSVSGHYLDKPQSYVYDNYDVQFSYKQIEVNSVLRYKIGNQQLKFFLDLGISNAFSFDEVNTLSYHHQFFSTEYSREEPAAISRIYEVGGLVGAGARFKPFFMEARYEIGSAMSLYATSYRYSILVGYFFR